MARAFEPARCGIGFVSGTQLQGARSHIGGGFASLASQVAQKPVNHGCGPQPAEIGHDARGSKSLADGYQCRSRTTQQSLASQPIEMKIFE